MKKIFPLLLLIPTLSYSQSIDLRNYWPNPTAGTQLISQEYRNGTIKTILKRYVKKGAVIQLDEYTVNGWTDSWEYKEIGNEIIETGTIFPGSHLVYDTTAGIRWGGATSVGTTFGQSIHVNVANSTGVTTGYWNYGYQQITVDSLLTTFTSNGGLTFSNVVKLIVFQSWCANSGCSYPSGQTITNLVYWMAPSVGIIQIDYGTRIDYTLELAETWETP